MMIMLLDEQVKNVVAMFKSLGLYEESFEPFYLGRTARFYELEGQAKMQTLEVHTYLEHCDRRLAEEFSRSEDILEATSRKPLLAAVEACLLERHLGEPKSMSYLTYLYVSHDYHYYWRKFGNDFCSWLQELLLPGPPGFDL
jgi:hypothetical protein